MLKRPLLPSIIKEVTGRISIADPSTTIENVQESARQKLKKFATRYMECMNILLKDATDARIRAIVNKQDLEGNTPLHCAVENWPQNIVKGLLRFGADLSIENNVERIPLRKIPKETIVQFLDEYCMKTDGLDVLDDEQEDDEEAYKNLLDDFEPRFMTNIVQSPITFDYELLTPTRYRSVENNDEVDTTPNPEMSVLTAISKSIKHRDLVTHPVLKSLVWIKWNLVSRYYSRKLRMDLMLTYFLTWYIFNQFGGLEWNARCEVSSVFSPEDENFCSHFKERYRNITNDFRYGEKENMTIIERMENYFVNFGIFGKCQYLDAAYLGFIPISFGLLYWMLKDMKRLFFSPNPYAHGGKPAPTNITFNSVILPLGLDIINILIIL